MATDFIVRILLAAIIWKTKIFSIFVCMWRMAFKYSQVWSTSFVLCLTSPDIVARGAECRFRSRQCFQVLNMYVHTVIVKLSDIGFLDLGKGMSFRWTLNGENEYLFLNLHIYVVIFIFEKYEKIYKKVFQ